VSLESDALRIAYRSPVLQRVAEEVVDEFHKNVVAGDHIETGELYNGARIGTEVTKTGHAAPVAEFHHQAALPIEYGHVDEHGNRTPGQYNVTKAVETVNRRIKW
jgi:hypothetical protein